MEIRNKTVTKTEFFLMLIVIVVGVLVIIGIISEVLSSDNPAYTLGGNMVMFLFGLLFASLINSDANKRKYDHVWLGVLLGLEFSLLGYIAWMMIRPNILQKTQ